MDLRNAVEKLMEAQQSKKDYVTDSRNLTMTEEAGLSVQGNGDYAVLDQAHRQVSEKWGIPWKYYERCKDTAPDLLAANVNRWLKEEPKRSFVRTGLGNVRAVLSERYRPIDHLDVLAPVINGLQQCPGARASACNVDERKLHVAIRNTDVREQITPKVGDIVEAGFILTNSETGHSALTVEPRIMRLSCLNGLTVPDMAFRQVHLGRTLTEELIYSPELKERENALIVAKVSENVKSYFNGDKFRAIVQLCKDAAERTVPAPVEIVRAIGESQGWGEKMQDSIIDRLCGGAEETTQWGLVNAITAEAKDARTTRETNEETLNRLFSRSMNLERFAGKVLKATLADIAKIHEAKDKAKAAAGIFGQAAEDESTNVSMEMELAS